MSLLEVTHVKGCLPKMMDGYKDDKDETFGANTQVMTWRGLATKNGKNEASDDDMSISKSAGIIN